MLTGESRPVTKSPGDALMGGTINAGSCTLTLAVTAAAGDSAVARLAALVETAAGSKSRGARAVEAFARWYTPATVAGAALLLVVLVSLHPEQWRDALYLSLVVLVTACPCALVISTPVASAAGLARAAGAGVLIKGGRYLELLGQVRGRCSAASHWVAG
jgi:Cd2+/Zn2+-exporting ATPase